MSKEPLQALRKDLNPTYRVGFILGVTAALLGTLSQILFFYQFAGISHQLVVERTFVLSDNGLLALGGFAVLWIGGLWTKDYMASRTRLSVCMKLQQHIQHHLSERQAALVRERSRFSWQQVWFKDIPAVADYLTQFRSQALIARFVPLFGLAAIAIENWFVALIFLLCLPVLPLFMVIIGRNTAAMHQKHIIALERLGVLFINRLKTLSTLHIFRRTTQEQHHLMIAQDELNRRTMKIVSLAFLNNTVLDFIGTLSVALIAVFIGFSLLGELAIGPAINFHQGLFILLLAPVCIAELKTLGKQYHQKANAEAVAENLWALYKGSDDLPKGAVDGKSVSVSPSEMSTSLLDATEFKVTTPELFSSHLRVQPGDKILVSGQSGAGKTCLFEALMGTRAATHRLSGKVVMLNQHALITSKSVRQNLCLSDNFCDQALVDALAAVELTSWLANLESGLDTLMGEYPPLSGGQAQRLALARALLRKADCYLLDEPTAHLTDSQHLHIVDIIQRSLASATVIWCSHRPLATEWFTQQWTIANKQVSML